MTENKTENSPKSPTWDGAQLTMASWLEALEQWLFKKDDDYLTLILYGYVTVKFITVVPTEIHAVALREGLLKDCSFDDPMSPDIFVHQAIPAGYGAWVDTAETKVQLKTVERVDRLMAQDILSTITSDSERKSWAAKANRSGLRLLPLLQTQRRTPNDVTDLAVQNHLHAMLSRGVGSISIAAFNEFRDEMEEWNAAASDDVRL